jgi:hypothetical protein
MNMAMVYSAQCVGTRDPSFGMRHPPEGQMAYGTGAYVQYSLPGFVNGTAGSFEVGGYWLDEYTFHVVHHFFNPFP